MYKTKIDISQKVRIQMQSILQDRLSDSIDLTIQAKQAHWNVKGPNFIALHELFDKIAAECQNYADLIAERMVQLGGKADGTINKTAKDSSLPKYPTEISTGKEHIIFFSHALATYGELIRKAIGQANELNDAGTADIFTEISRGVDKNLWFVEAHIQAEK
jgi:starvation-inducible DNA-binding protein